MPRVTLTQTTFTAGELSPRVLGRTDMDRYQQGMKRARNGHAVLHGGFKRRAGSMLVAAAYVDTASASVLVPFVEGQGKAWMLEFGNLVVRIYNADRTYTGVQIASPYTAAQLALIDWAQSDSTMWLAHPSVAPQRLQRLGAATWVLSPAPFTQIPFDEVGFVGAPAITLSASSVGVGRTATASGSVFMASDVGRAITFDAGIAVVTGYTSVTVVTVEITRAFPSTAVPAAGWTMDSSPQTTCTPSAASPVGATITLTLSAAGWRAGDVGGVVRMNAGLCRITSITSTTIANAVILRELSAAVGSPPLSWSLEPVVWTTALGFPRSVTIHQQRSIFAGTTRFPRTVWGSRIGEPLDFERWTDDSDSFAFTIDGDEATPIKYVTSGKQLAVMTDSAEYSLRSGVEKPITPTNVRVVPESNHGTAQVRPAQVNDEQMFVQRAGRKVRAFGYRYDADAYKSPDISALAEHITATGVTWMTFAQEPEQMLWASRGDGKVLSSTIDRDQQPSVIAWALHTTDGFVECMQAMPGDDRDIVWMIVRRTVNGATKRYLEVLDDTFQPFHPAAPLPPNFDEVPVYGCTVDAGKLFDNLAGASAFSVPHLAGKKVAIVADGSKMFDGFSADSPVVAADGSVGISRPGKRVLIGLPFRTEGVLLTPEVQTGLGSAQGQAARTGEMFMRFLNTIGAKVQNNAGNEQIVPFRQFGVGILDNAPMPFTGLLKVTLLGWERGDSEISVIQDDPLPMHLLAAIRTHQIGGG